MFARNTYINVITCVSTTHPTKKSRLCGDSLRKECEKQGFSILAWIGQCVNAPKKGQNKSRFSSCGNGSCRIIGHARVLVTGYGRQAIAAYIVNAATKYPYGLIVGNPVRVWRQHRAHALVAAWSGLIRGPVHQLDLFLHPRPPLLSRRGKRTSSLLSVYTWHKKSNPHLPGLMIPDALDVSLKECNSNRSNQKTAVPQQQRQTIMQSMDALLAWMSASPIPAPVLTALAALSVLGIACLGAVIGMTAQSWWSSRKKGGPP